MSSTDLFAADRAQARVSLAPGAFLLRGFALTQAPRLLEAVAAIAALAPFRHFVTPGARRMSVAMTNCGSWGWVSDRRGYRYSDHDPQTGARWPALPDCFLALADASAGAAGYAGFVPDACLVNRYSPGARLSLHQDQDETDFSAPIVSVSLGLPAVFEFGGASRRERPHRITLHHGDVVVWGGPSRRCYHGVLPLADGTHPATGPTRVNLTLRKAH